jgi:hypoxanthine phosphoribosyltransferase
MAEEVEAFPLRSKSPGPHLREGLIYPRSYTFSDGYTAPLFTSGVLSAAEIERIAQATAAAIAQRYGGQRVLVVLILEGARCFGEMVLGQLKQWQEVSSLHYEVATIQIRSYEQGSQVTTHRALQPLQDLLGKPLLGCADFDGVALVDDLIDAGNTLAWLIREYLPQLLAKDIGIFTLLEKDRLRSAAAEEALAGCAISTGRRVPDEWLVGYGLDLALPGGEGFPARHLFRQALPGGIYAFNSTIEKRLLTEYQTNPRRVLEQLAAYLSFH